MIQGSGCKVSKIDLAEAHLLVNSDVIHITSKIKLLDNDDIKLGENTYLVFSKEVLEAAQVLITALEKDAARLTFVDADSNEQLNDGQNAKEEGDILDILERVNRIPEKFNHQYETWDIE
jgi:hypothetical protein